VVLIRVELATAADLPAYVGSETEGQVKIRWRRSWRKLWEEVEDDAAGALLWGYLYRKLPRIWHPVPDLLNE